MPIEGWVQLGGMGVIAFLVWQLGKGFLDSVKQMRTDEMKRWETVNTLLTAQIEALREAGERFQRGAEAFERGSMEQSKILTQFLNQNRHRS